MYGKVAMLICDVYMPNGEPFEGDPRFVLKRNVKKMKALGFEEFNVGVEPEFFLFDDVRWSTEPNNTFYAIDEADVDAGRGAGLDRPRRGARWMGAWCSGRLAGEPTGDGLSAVGGDARCGAQRIFAG